MTTKAARPGPACRLPSFIRDRACEAERPSWLERRLSSRRPSQETTTCESKEGPDGDLESAESQQRSLRPLPEHLAEDGFAAKPFDFGKTEGISESPVGSGCQALIYGVRRSDSNGVEKAFAIKVLKRHLARDPDELRAFQREVNLLARLNHEHVCCLMAVGTTPDEELPCVMLEWVPGTVSDVMRLSLVGTNQREKAQVERYWPPQERLRLARELAAALRYLHYRALDGCVVLHRDLKPDNYGICPDGKFKLLDFGLSVCLLKPDDGSTPLCASTYQLTGGTGSIRYMSPEVALENEYGAAADVYSFAVSVWEFLLLLGKPYANLGVRDHKQRVVKGGLRPPLPARLDRDLACLLESAWAMPPHKRPDFEHIHTTLSKLVDSKAPLYEPSSTKACLCGS